MGVKTTRANLGRRLLASSALTAILICAGPRFAFAQNWTGANSSDWFDGGNWSGGVVPTNATGANFDTISPNPTVIGAAGAVSQLARLGDTGTGQVTVTGSGSTWNIPGGLVLGFDVSGQGTLVIQNGGAVSSTGTQIGSLGTGIVTVTGSGSQWTETNFLVLGANAGSNGHLNVLNGGRVDTPFTTVGSLGGIGTVKVDGAGSTVTSAGGMTIGANPATVSQVTVSNGALLQSGLTYVGATGFGVMEVIGTNARWINSSLIAIANDTSSVGSLMILSGAYVQSVGGVVGQGGLGRALVAGSDAVWNAADVHSNGVYVGQSDGSTGNLTVSAGGKVSATAIKIGLDASATATGVINIGAAAGQAPVAPGTLDTPQIIFGASATGNLVFNHTSTNYIFSPVITTTADPAVPSVAGNKGEVDVLSGTTTLTAANTYRGRTNISGGTLLVDGSIIPSVTSVGSGGTLGGTGTVGITSVAGTLAPGDSGAIGTLHVQGDLSFSSGATYKVDVSPSNADLTKVTGTATLGNATVSVTFSPGSYVARQYTILSANGGVSGTFSKAVQDPKVANFVTSLSYDPDNVYLNLALTFTPPAGPNFSGGLSGNQQAVANSLINYFNSNGGIPLIYATLSPTGLTQVSGEGATGSQQTTFDAMNQFMGVMTDPFIAGRNSVGSGGGPTAYAADEQGGMGRTRNEREAYAAMYGKALPPASTFEQRWSVWAAGFGGSQRTDGNVVVGSNDTRSSIYGTAVGVDYRLAPNTLAGFALAGGGTNFSVNTLGSGRSDLFQAGAFIRHDWGPAYLTGALAYGWQDITTDRTLLLAGLDHLRAEFNANAWSGRLEGGYRFTTAGVGITPYAAGQFVTFDLPAYAEQVVVGAPNFALNYTAKSVTDTRSELGVRGDRSFAMQNGILTLRGRLAWAHDFDPDRNVLATFQALPGASFVVNGAARAADSALTTASAEMTWINGWSAAATFEGEFSSVTQSYAGKGVIRYAW